jgi:hypothetical protein
MINSYIFVADLGSVPVVALSALKENRVLGIHS